MSGVYRIVNDRPVIDGKEEEQISQEQEMKDLLELHEGMTAEEQDRTMHYLNRVPEKSREVFNEDRRKKQQDCGRC